MLKEFKEFALKGNMIDLAIGVIIGAAFGTIVTSLVNDIMMPILGVLTGGIDFSQLFYVMGGENYSSLKEARDAGAAAVAYGQFIQSVISFLLVAIALFFVVKAMNKLRKNQAEAPPPAPPRQEVLLEEIRNLLAKGR